jgi:hypothetical protein
MLLAVCVRQAAVTRHWDHGGRRRAGCRRAPLAGVEERYIVVAPVEDDKAPVRADMRRRVDVL